MRIVSHAPTAFTFRNLWFGANVMRDAARGAARRLGVLRGEPRLDTRVVTRALRRERALDQADAVHRERNGLRANAREPLRPVLIALAHTAERQGAR